MSPWAPVLLIANALSAEATVEANAEDDPRQGEREYTLHIPGTDKCSSPALLRKELERKLPGYRFPDAPADDARLVVSFSRVRGELEVHIRLEKYKGEVLTRRLGARDCEEARLAASFVVSVALQEQMSESPAADLGSEEASGAPPRAGTTTAEATAAATSSQASNAAPNNSTGPLLLAETATTARPRKRSARPAAKIDSWLSARMTMLAGPAPSPLLGGEVAFGIGRAAPGLWAPAFELGLSYAAAFPTRTTLGTAGFDVGTLGLAACPSLGELGRVRLRPCVVGHFGFLHAVGSDTSEPGTSTRPWADVGLRLDGLIRLGRRFDIYLGIDGRYNINQDKFLFDSQVFHSIPPLSLGGGLGVVVHFQ